MPEIKKIQKELHKKKSAFATREHDTTYYNEWRAERDIAKGKSFLSRLIDRTANTKMRAVLIGAIVIITLVIFALAIWVIVYFQRSFFMQEHVQFTVSMPQKVDSNQTIEVTFSYENDNRATLHHAEIVVNYGQYFIPAPNQDTLTQTGVGRGVVQIGEIAGHQKDTTKIVGHFIAPQNTLEDISATLSYVPDRTSSTYTKNAQTTITITSSPVTLEGITEKDVVSGNIVSIHYVLRNTSPTDLTNLQMRVQYPEGFTFQKSQPQPEIGTEDTWDIARLGAHTTKDITIFGIASGNVNDVLQFHATLSSRGENAQLYAQSTQSIHIIPSPITISQEVTEVDDDVVYAGKLIPYTLQITNNSQVPLRDVIVTLNIDGSAVAYDKITLKNKGFYDPEKRQIFWKASDIPALATMQPGDEVVLSFRLPIKDIIPIDGTQKSQFTVTTVALVDSPDLPSSVRDNKKTMSAAYVVRVGAKVLTDLQLTHRDGPLPPRVGEQTTYDVTLHAGVVNNDLKDAVFSGSLQSGVTFITQDDDKNSDLQVNRRTNNFMWHIGTIKHGTGVTTPMLKKQFTIAFKPGENYVGKTPMVIKNLSFDAQDTFTHKTFHITLPDISILQAQQDGHATIQPRQAPAQSQPQPQPQDETTPSS